MSYAWEDVIREFYKDKGVRFKPPNAYEAFTSIKGRFVSYGTYPTEEIARSVFINAKIKAFTSAVSANGDIPSEIMPTKDKGYFASPKGNVYNASGRLMSPSIDHCGYKHTLFNGKNRNIHRVIAETFIPNPNNYSCINHKDGNKLNNCVDNLEWCTHSYNTSHAYANGLEKKVLGESHHNHKLTENDVHFIRKNYIKRDKTFGAVPLAEKFNVDRTTILDVIRYKTWRHI